MTGGGEGDILRHKKFMLQIKKWTNSVGRSLNWSLGDVEPITFRMRMVLCHLRDARRDGKIPPRNLAHLASLQNMVHVDCILAAEKDEDVQQIHEDADEPLQPKAQKKKHEH